MNRVRLLWFLSIVTILAMVLASCAPAATEAPVVEEPAEEPAEEPVEEEPPAAEKATVTLWTDPPGGGEAATCLAETVESWIAAIIFPVSSRCTGRRIAMVPIWLP